MKDSNYQPFEKVELLSPVEMIPIETTILGTTEEKKEFAPDKQQAVKPHTEPVTDSYNTDGFTYDGNYEEQYTGQQHTGSIGFDLNKIFRDEEDYKNKLLKQKTRRIAIAITGFSFLILLVLIVFLSNIYRTNRSSRLQSVVDSGTVSDINRISLADYAKQDDVYGTIDFDLSDKKTAEYFDISREIIEYTGPYTRKLYFKVTPNKENALLKLSVEMIDRYGNSLGTVISYTKSLPVGETGLVEIPFGIDQSTELNDITYKIQTEAYQMQDKMSYKNITQVEQKDGVIYVKIEGDLSVQKDAYLILYKNGKVCSVLYDSAGTNSDNMAVFFVGDIDFDEGRIFY